MLGLRKRESVKFENFFALIQKQAKKQNCVFFADAGDGHDGEFTDFECEDMMGWLIPEENKDSFEKEWKSKKLSRKWEDVFCWAMWEKPKDSIEPVIRFQFF